MSRDGSVGIATRLRAGQSRNRGSVSGLGRVFLFSKGSFGPPFAGTVGSFSGSVVAGSSGLPLTSI